MSFRSLQPYRPTAHSGLVLLLSGLLLTISLTGCSSGPRFGTAAVLEAEQKKQQTAPPASERTLHLLAMQALQADSELMKQSHIRVVIDNNQLMLIGQARSKALSQRAQQAVSKVSGNRQVHNQIRLQSPTSLTTRSHDSWLTGQVKSQLLMSKQTSGQKIQVVTENSEVFLLGRISRSQASAAIEITRNTAGVKRVVTLFDYL